MHKIPYVMLFDIPNVALKNKTIHINIRKDKEMDDLLSSTIIGGFIKKM